ncbi:MAG: DUF3592 domain-containing protein [Bryobacteraceae bacterium]
MSFFAILWLLFLLVFILRVAGVSPESLRRRRSQSWPWAKTTIESGSVEPVSQGRSRVYRLTLGYSYAVNGDEYGGAYTESFRSEHEAQSVLKSLQELPPPARYKPGDPSESVMDPYRDAALGL